MALVVDGDFGKVTKKYFQSYLSHEGYYHGYVDGWFGPQSVKALQKWLKYTSRSTTFYAGLIDGDAGWMTWNGLFNALRYYGYGYGNSHVGVMNYKLAQMLQKFLNDRPYLFS